MKKLLLSMAASSLLLTGCEAVNLLSSVGSVLAPMVKSSASPSPGASVSPSPSASANSLPFGSKAEAVAANSPTPLTTDWNMARIEGVQLNVSSTLNEAFSKSRLTDGNFETSWFTNTGDAASQGRLPTVDLSFAQPVGVLGLNLRGNRERQQGLQIQEVSLLISGPKGMLLNETVALPASPDVNIVFKTPLDQVTSIRMTLTRDSSNTPGLAELEVVGRK